MTAEMAPAPQAEPQTGTWMRRLVVVMIGALVLAVAAGSYRHGERDDARRETAKNAGLSRDTQDLQRKVAAARANVAATRRRLRVQASTGPALLKLLDELNANHSSMSAIVRDQDRSSAQIVDALADGRYTTYNNLADRFTASTRTVDTLAAMETKLRNALSRLACSENCAAREDAAHLPPK